MTQGNPRELLTQLRTSHSRARIVTESNGALTPAKIFNIERGREPTAAEVVGITAAWDSLVGDVQPVRPSQLDPVLGPSAARSPHATDLIEEPKAGVVDTLIAPTEPEPTSELQPESTVVDLSTVDLSTVEPSVDRGPVVLGSPQLGPTARTQVDGLRRISNSQVQLFKSCRRRWYLATYRGLQEAVESPLGVRQVGHRIHRALSEFYAPPGVAPIDPRVALDRLIDEDWSALVDNPAARLLVDEPNFHIKFRAQADLERIIIDGYVEWCRETGADSELCVTEPEAYMEVYLAELNSVLIGRLDVRVTRTTGGVTQRLFIDHKVVGNVSTTVSTLRLDEQLQWYMLLELLSGGDDLDRSVGAIYNILRRVKRTAQAKPPFFSRVEVHHNPIQLTSFLHRTLGTLRDMLAVYDALDSGADHRSVAYPTPTRDCPWRCQFFQVCSMLDDGSRAEDALSQLYVVGDPLGYYDTSGGGPHDPVLDGSAG